MSKNDIFEKIMKEIVANIPEGDKEIFKYLNEQMRSYKGHKYEQEIARACGRLLYERLSPDARKKFDDDGLKELAESIAEHGMLEPLCVEKDGEKYHIVAGMIRFEAAKLAGLKEVPVIVRWEKT